MKLIYRGIQYDYSPPVIETPSIEAIGKYRGVDVRFRTMTHSPVHPLKVDLMYRSVPYTSGEAVEQPAVAPAPARTLADRVRFLVMGKERNRRQREQSMLTHREAELGLS
jgi:hypothetical protein